MLINIKELGTYSTLPLMDEQPGVWEACLKEQLHFLEKETEGTYRNTTLTIEHIQPIAAILTRESRKRFLTNWASSIYPVVNEHDDKLLHAILLHRLKNTKFGFIKKGEGETRVLKRWVTQWELMTEYTMAFRPDGYFVEFPFPLSEEEDKLVESLIDTETNVEEHVEAMKRKFANEQQNQSVL